MYTYYPRGGRLKASRATRAETGRLQTHVQLAILLTHGEPRATSQHGIADRLIRRAWRQQPRSVSNPSGVPAVGTALGHTASRALEPLKIDVRAVRLYLNCGALAISKLPVMTVSPLLHSADLGRAP